MILARTATADDAPRLFEWRNDAATRAASLDWSEIEWEDHLAWLDRTLDDPDTFLCVASVDGEPVGTCRFDVIDGSAEVSITVAPSARGRGLGGPILAASREAFVSWRGERMPLTATIRDSNVASIRLFTAAGFELVSSDPERRISHYTLRPE